MQPDCKRVLARDRTGTCASRWRAVLPLFLACTIANSVEARAQGTVAIDVSDSAQTALVRGGSARLALIVRPSGGLDIASIAGHLSWDAARLKFDSVVAGRFGSLTVNAAAAAGGLLTVQASRATGQTTRDTLAILFFTADTAAASPARRAFVGGTRVHFLAGSALNQAGGNVMPNLTVRSLDVCVVSGRWGDVNDDRVVNIIDAQQLARHAVGLSVADDSAVAQRGDLTADGTANIIDAQQVARFSVGLSASPRADRPAFVSPVVTSVQIVPWIALGPMPSTPLPVVLGGGPIALVAVTRNALGAALFGCSPPMVWASSTVSRATVTAVQLSTVDGANVSGVGSGAATITASSGVASGSVNVAVYDSLLTGMTVTVSSPLPAKRYFIFVDSSGLGPSSQVTEVAAPTPNSRLLTATVAAPPATDYSIGVLVTDSAGATSGLTNPQVAAAGRASGITVGINARTSVSVTATAVTASVLSAPAIRSLGTKAGITWQLRDPSRMMRRTGNCSGIWYTSSPLTGDGPGGGRSATVCATLTANIGDTLYSYSDSIPSPVSSRTLYYQLENRWSNGAGIAPSFWTPSVQRSEPARSVVFRTDTSAMLSATAIAGGSEHTCGITASGAYCWGRNNFGQLGDSTTTDRLVTTRVKGGLSFSALAPANNASATCGIATTGAAFCWGTNSTGGLGNGTTDAKVVPTSVAGGHTFASVATSGGHACALTAAGAAFCWGRNESGQLGDSTITNRLVPTAVHGGLQFSAITVGASSCGIATGGAAYCWGPNAQGQLGNGTFVTAVRPVAVTGGLTFSALTATSERACGLTSSGAAYCWGRNDNGELGDGTLVTSPVPVAVQGGLTFSSITSGWRHACGLTNAGAAFCWGVNASGQLGDGTTTMRPAPVAVGGGLTFSKLSAGLEHTCGLTVNQKVYCWGRNLFGRLGDNGTSDRLLPEGVLRP